VLLLLLLSLLHTFSFPTCTQAAHESSLEEEMELAAKMRANLEQQVAALQSTQALDFKR
jgi:hypothetical protein